MIDIKENELLKNHSTFRIGGEARYFCVVKNAEEIKEAVNFAKEKNLPYVVIGMGSNILYHDKGYEGVVIKSQISNLNSQNLIITAGSGVLLAQVVNLATENGLSGLEWAIGIPGTIGGAVVDNTGAFGKSISESVIKVKILDIALGGRAAKWRLGRHSRQECEFKYRDSRFKPRSVLDGKKDRPLSEIILEVELELEPGNPEEIRERIKTNMAQRKDRIPPYPSIGCIFKNPKPLSAGKLIEDCGLKGVKVGNAQISEIHANMIVNLEDASAKDVLELIERCKKEVREKFNLDLEEEIVII